MKTKVEACWSCEATIVVPIDDNAPRYYCYPCAMAKMGEVPA